MTQSGNLREVLQYIPQFRGKVFLVLIEAGLLPEPAIAETLLDLAVLEDLGVKLVLGVLGGDLKDLYDWTLECEIMAARVAAPDQRTRMRLGKPSTSSPAASPPSSTPPPPARWTPRWWISPAGSASPRSSRCSKRTC